VKSELILYTQHFVEVLVFGELYLVLCNVTGCLVLTIAECTSYGNVKFM
jgi:hypothetical protein